MKKKKKSIYEINPEDKGALFLMMQEDNLKKDRLDLVVPELSPDERLGLYNSIEKTEDETPELIQEKLKKMEQEKEEIETEKDYSHPPINDDMDGNDSDSNDANSDAGAQGGEGGSSGSGASGGNGGAGGGSGGGSGGGE